MWHFLPRKEKTKRKDFCNIARKRNRVGGLVNGVGFRVAKLIGYKILFRGSIVFS